MINISDTSYIENQSTHFCSITFFENYAVCETMRKNIVDPGRSQVTIWRRRIASCVPKARDTHSEYVILIAFPLQQ